MRLRARRPGSKTRSRSGAAAVEFMAALPVLTTLLLAGIDFGMFGFRYVQINNAAMAGAVYASMNPYDETVPAQVTAWRTGIREAARDEMFAKSEAARRARVQVSTPVVTIQTPVGSPTVRMIGVVVTYDFNTIVDWPMVPRTVLMKGAAQVRAIR